MVRYHGPKYGIQSFDDFIAISDGSGNDVQYRGDECKVI